MKYKVFDTTYADEGKALSKLLAELKREQIVSITSSGCSYGENPYHWVTVVWIP